MESASPKSTLKILDCDRGDVLSLLRKRCQHFNDPARCRGLLDAWLGMEKLVFIDAPDAFINTSRDVSAFNGDNAEPEGMQRLASLAQLLVVYSVRPGRSSYSIFVEARCPCGPGGELATEDVHRRHQVRLFLSALRGVLALPRPPGPGRLAFSAIPGYAAGPMLRALREAGHEALWDEPCARYTLPLEAWECGGLPADGRGAQVRTATAEAGDREEARAPCTTAGLVEGQDLPYNSYEPYVLDTLRTEADAELVDRHWTYRSPYSMALVRMLMGQSHAVCVRWRPPPSPPRPQQCQGTDGSSSRSHRDIVLTGTPRENQGPHGLQASNHSDTDTQAASAASEASGAMGTAAISASSGPSCGALSSRSSSDAVAWILQYADGSLGMAHTLQGHRRRGLMRRCVMELLRRAAAAATAGDDEREGGRQKEAFVYIVPGNTASVALFESLGLRRSPDDYHWFGVEGSGAEDAREE